MSDAVTNSNIETINTNSQALEDVRDARILELEAQLNELKSQLDGERIQTAVAKTVNRLDTVSNAHQDLKRQKVIQAAGGLSKFRSMSEADRIRTYNEGVYIEIAQEKLESLFGPHASGTEAQRLRTSDPVFYKAARALAKERNLL